MNPRFDSLVPVSPPSSGMRRRRGLWLLAAGLTLAWGPGLRDGPGRAQAQGGRDFQIIVHPSNPATVVDRRFVSQAFLKKTTHWQGGESIRPVDLPAGWETRRRFSEAIHGRSAAAVKSYWQQVIFSGRGLPPPELDSEEAVIRHVTRSPGGIGYVSPSADLRGAKVLSVR